MTPRRRAGLIGLAALILALALAPVAVAAAGGGSAGFGGGGGGFGHGGGGGRGAGLYILIQILIRIAIFGHGLGIVILIGLVLLIWAYVSLVPRARAFYEARASSGTAGRRAVAKRTRRVQLAAAEAADEDPAFDPESVTASAAQLFLDVQAAWDADDRIALRGLVSPSLLGEWERRLDDFERRGWRNRVQPLEPPNVEYVGLRRHGDEARDRVVVRIEARLRDFVTDPSGRHIRRAGHATETVRTREFWTLGRRDAHWILASIEQGAEGHHLLDDQILATPWSDEQALRDEALVEGAVDDAVPAGTSIAELADLQYEGDARAAALDLSLADGRFAPAVLEVAARRAVTAWSEAIDGDDSALRAIADSAAVRGLLHPGDPSGRTRLVVRGLEIRQIRIAGLDAANEPPTMTIEIDLRGRRYLEDRATTAIVAGSQSRAQDFSERWTLALNGESTQPWRIVSVGTPLAAA
ncbi:MAG: TIM44-like domain-containing protein [Solirubrobacteraceae bacterium]